jgi:hypothetical protein
MLLHSKFAIQLTYISKIYHKTIFDKTASASKVEVTVKPKVTKFCMLAPVMILQCVIRSVGLVREYTNLCFKVESFFSTKHNKIVVAKLLYIFSNSRLVQQMQNQVLLILVTSNQLIPATLFKII